MKVPPKYKTCRRLGDGVFSKCQTPKYQLAKSRKTYKTKFSRGPRTEYGVQLVEKQKVRYSYNISEKQMSNYVKKASKTRGATPVDALQRLLESRLDNVVYRVGIAASRQQARQMVSHGHIAVNGRKLTIPSYEVRIGDKVGVSKKSIDSELFHDVGEKIKETVVSSWINIDKSAVATIAAAPLVTVPHEADLDFATVIEFYNRV